MAVVRLDSPLEVCRGHARVQIELRRVHHLVFGLGDRHPLFAYVTTNLFDRDQKMLLAYPQETSRAHDQEARLASFPVDVEVLYATYLLVGEVVDVEPPGVLPRLF